MCFLRKMRRHLSRTCWYNKTEHCVSILIFQEKNGAIIIFLVLHHLCAFFQIYIVFKLEPISPETLKIVFLLLLWAMEAVNASPLISTDCRLSQALSSVYISNILCDNFIVTFYLISIYVNKGYMIFHKELGRIWMCDCALKKNRRESVLNGRHVALNTLRTISIVNI